MEEWSNNILRFYELAQQESVRMIMVGGGAVNFHGYKRHSADVDFWIDTSSENLQKLIDVLQKMNYSIHYFPEEVLQSNQNISVKFSPKEPLNLELITRFSVNKYFDKIYKNEAISTSKNAAPAGGQGDQDIKVKVLNYDDLITSKVKSNRPKDLLDIQELERVNNSKDYI